MSDPPIEVTTRYATTVGSLTAAWSFVMNHIDTVGLAPSVTITPRWSAEDDYQVARFSVVVEGMTEQPQQEAPE